MKNQLIPPPELAPPSIRHLPMESRIELWAKLMDESEQFLLAGFRNKTDNPDAAADAYRHWYARQMQDHDGIMEHLLAELRRRENNRAG